MSRGESIGFAGRRVTESTSIGEAEELANDGTSRRALMLFSMAQAKLLASISLRSFRIVSFI